MLCFAFCFNTAFHHVTRVNVSAWFEPSYLKRNILFALWQTEPIPIILFHKPILFRISTLIEDGVLSQWVGSRSTSYRSLIRYRCLRYHMGKNAMVPRDLTSVGNSRASSSKPVDPNIAFGSNWFIRSVKALIKTSDSSDSGSYPLPRQLWYACATSLVSCKNAAKSSLLVIT